MINVLNVTILVELVLDQKKVTVLLKLLILITPKIVMPLLKKITPKSVHLDIMPSRKNVTNVTNLVKNVLDLKPSIVSESKNPNPMIPPVLT
jgi:hypothetical protein